MRVACVHVPLFALQSLTRVDPSLRGTPLAVVGAGTDLEPGLGARARAALHSPVVLACSRAARAVGVRIGMTAAAARAAAPEVHVLAADPDLEREAARALADALLGASAVVDAGGRVGPAGAHLAMYCEVPAKTRGTTFGERLIARAAAAGVACRVGIADDRFTAWVAASAPADDRDRRADDRAVVSVPRGGSAAYLAPHPLSLLAISPEVQRMLGSLGVRTLGEFAALPAPSIARPIEADYQALARGESGGALRPYAPDAPVRERAAIAPAIAGGLSAPAAIAMVAARVAARLAARRRLAARLEIVASGRAGSPMSAVVPLRLGHALETPDEIAEAIAGAVGELGMAWSLRVTVVGEVIASPQDRASAEAPAASRATWEPGAGELAALALAVTSAAESAPPEPRGLDLAELRPGSLLGLRAERRTAHQRTGRGTRRPRRGGALPGADALLQPRLFKNLP
jgi:protein ImuB